jgi:hypothetical protein
LFFQFEFFGFQFLFFNQVPRVSSGRPAYRQTGDFEDDLDEGENNADDDAQLQLPLKADLRRNAASNVGRVKVPPPNNKSKISKPNRDDDTDAQQVMQRLRHENRKLFVRVPSELANGNAETVLQQHFSQFGAIESLEMNGDKCFVTFVEKSSAVQASKRGKNCVCLFVFCCSLFHSSQFFTLGGILLPGTKRPLIVKWAFIDNWAGKIAATLPEKKTDANVVAV